MSDNRKSYLPVSTSQPQAKNYYLPLSNLEPKAGITKPQYLNLRTFMAVLVGSIVEGILDMKISIKHAKRLKNQLMFTSKIVTWNANELLKHVHELQLFLHNENVDLCLLSETHNTSQTYINIKGYIKYSANHPHNIARGGVVILAKENIKQNEHSQIETEHMQVITISLKINQKICNISAIYCPPRFKLKSVDFIQLMKSLGSCFIIGGDFNAKNVYWGSRLNNPKGRDLLRAGKYMKCNFHSGNSPTYWPSDPQKIPDTIDFFISKGINTNHVEIQNSADLSLDHSPVIMMVSDSIMYKPDSPYLTNNKTNWKNFRCQVENRTNLHVLLKTPAEVENVLDTFIEIIQEAAWMNSPVNHIDKNFKVPENIKNLIKSKRKARSKWQKYRTPENKNILNKLCNKIKNIKKQTEQSSLSNKLRNVTATKDTEYSLWKTTNQYYSSVTQTTIPHLKRNDGTWAKSAEEKLSIFADYLEDTFKPLQMNAEENIIYEEKK